MPRDKDVQVFSHNFSWNSISWNPVFIRASSDWKIGSCITPFLNSIYDSNLASGTAGVLVWKDNRDGFLFLFFFLTTLFFRAISGNSPCQFPWTHIRKIGIFRRTLPYHRYAAHQSIFIGKLNK